VRTENLPPDPVEVAESWEARIDELAKAGSSGSLFTDPPDPRDHDFLPPSVADKTGLVTLMPLAPFLCAVFNREIKKFIRAVNPPRADSITRKDREAELRAIDGQFEAVSWELERAARALEGMGIEVTRPGDLDPRIFLAREL
jgi:hypothetical protein